MRALKAAVTQARILPRKGQGVLKVAHNDKGHDHPIKPETLGC